MAWAILLLPLLLLTACSQAAKPVPKPVPKPPPPSVTLGFCGSNLQVKPDVVLVVCGTDDITARNLVWSGWGTADTTAKGSATVDLCAYNDCAAADLVLGPDPGDRLQDRGLQQEHQGVLFAALRVPGRLAVPGRARGRH